jgi:NAD(P)H-flavin reductase
MTDSKGVASPWVPALATIVRIKQEAPAVATYRLCFDNEALALNYRFEAGQFNMLALPGIGEAAISVSSDPADLGGIDHTIRVVGNVTSNLATRKAGAKIAVRGPFGSAWPIESLLGKDLVLACGGLGLAPMRSVLQVIARRRAEFGRVMLLYGAREPKGLLFADEYEAWRNANIEVHLTVDIGDAAWRGNIGVVPALFARLRLVPEQCYVLTCGPEIMMRYVAIEALTRGVTPERLYLSMERNMSCGIGQCGHCQFGPAFICQQGPVFTYGQIEPYLYVEEF